jgi:hypothetical protein
VATIRRRGLRLGGGHVPDVSRRRHGGTCRDDGRAAVGPRPGDSGPRPRAARSHRARAERGDRAVAGLGVPCEGTGGRPAPARHDSCGAHGDRARRGALGEDVHHDASRVVRRGPALGARLRAARRREQRRPPLARRNRRTSSPGGTTS